MAKVTKVIKNYFIKPILWLVLIFLILVATTIFLARSDFVQNWLVDKATTYLSTITKHEVEVGHVYISWLDEVLLENVIVFDRQKNEMIKVGSLRANFDLITLISSKEPIISEVWLDRPSVQTIVLKDSERLNINELIEAFSNLSNKKDTSASAPFIFHVEKVHLKNGTYAHFDQTEDSLPGIFDYYHFTLDKITGEVDQMRIAGDTFEINVKDLSCIDTKTKLDAKELDVFYRFTAHSMQFHRLYGRIGNSVVRNYLEFGFNGTEDLSEFNSKVYLKAHLDSSIISSEDIAHFAPTLRGMNEMYSISTDIEGKVVNLSFKDLSLYYGKNSHMKGDISFRGLPNLDETFVNARFTKFSSNSIDMGRYVGSYTQGVMKRFGHVNYAGTFVGFFTDFVAKGKFETGLGTIASDINIKIKDNERHSAYKGKLKTVHFQLGKLMGKEDYIGTVDMDGSIQGTGFSYEHAHFNLDANINRIGLNQYNYHNIRVEAELKKEAFKGKLVCADTNATFTLNGLVDFSQTPHFLNFDADVGYINLKNINSISEPVSFTTKMKLNLVGTNLNDFEGDASFSHTNLTNGKKVLALDTLKIITERVDNDRYLNLFSDLVEINADGNFTYGGLIEDLPRLFGEYMMVIENKKSVVEDYYKNAKPYSTPDYRVNFNLLLKKANPLLALFNQETIISDNSRLGGTFAKNEQKASFNVIGLCSKIQLGGIKFYNSRLNYNSSKSLYHPFVDASGIIYSQKQQFSKAFKTDGCNLEVIWNNDKVLFNSYLQQKKTDNHINLNGNLLLKEGSKEFFFDKIDLKLLETQWVSDSANILLSEEDLEVKHFILKNNEQSISALGFVSKDPKKDLHIQLKQFGIKPFGKALEKNVDGKITGDIIFSNLLTKNFKLDFDGSINQLALDSFLIGNISGQTEWSSIKEQFDVGFSLSRDSIPNMEIKGFVKPYENNRLGLTAKLDNFNLQSFEPFIKDYFSSIKGECNGTLKIDGTLLKPNIIGDIYIGNGKFRFNFLNTTYSFSDNIHFDTSSIRFDETKLVDTIGNACLLNGVIEHKRFRDINFNIKGKFNDLLVMNTTEENNKLFYGKAFATGRMSVTGPLDNILVYVNAKNEDESKIFIPINTAESLGGNQFVTFTAKKQMVIIKNPDDDEEEVQQVVEEKKTSLTTVKLDLDLNPTMDFELILDKQAGDLIRGNGSGNLSLTTNTNGDFDIFGTYTFNKGLYNFTLLNLVNKKFDIVGGSSISWNGDPLSGNLDIKASLEEKASLRDILQESDTSWFSHPAIRKRYPAIVNLFVKGKLMHPEISYKIQIKDYPLTITKQTGESLPLDTYVRSFLQQLDLNEQQLNRQVFSLLVFRKFFPLTNESNSGLAGQGAAGTVSSLLSNQLSNWISQVDENLTIDIDLNGFNSQALTDLRLRLTYVPDLFDKRVRITRDGSFTNNQNKTSVNSIAGDWSLEYLITKDGMLRLRMFTKNNYNNLATSLNSGNQMSTGFSFMHTQSFDNLGELIKHKKKDEKGSLEEDVKPAPEPGAGIAPADTSLNKEIGDRPK